MAQLQPSSLSPPDLFEARRQLSSVTLREGVVPNSCREVPLLGRERDRQRLYDAARPGLRSLICGPHGIGKSRLLLGLKEEIEAEGSDVLYIRFTQPMHQLLLAFASAIGAGKERIPAGETSINLKGILWRILEGHPQAILLDDITAAGPHTYRFFERIVAIPGVSLLGAAIDQNSLGSLQRIFWDRRNVVSLKPLHRADAERLVITATRAFLPNIPFDPSLCGRILKAARGNPGRIVQMCRLAADPAYRDGERIRFAALNIDSLTAIA